MKKLFLICSFLSLSLFTIVGCSSRTYNIYECKCDKNCCKTTCCEGCNCGCNHGGECKPVCPVPPKPVKPDCCPDGCCPCKPVKPIMPYCPCDYEGLDGFGDKP